MKEREIQQALSNMAARKGFMAVGLVELDGGMVCHAAGSPDLCDSVLSSVSDYWRLYKRSQQVFSGLGPLNAAMFFHRAGRITVCECGPLMLLVVITELRNEIDWALWKQDHARLSHLIKDF